MMSEEDIGKALICPKCGNVIFINIKVTWNAGKSFPCGNRYGKFKCDYKFIKGVNF